MLVLASTSVYRRELLGRLRLPFATFSPCVDETPLPGEAPAATAVRLAQAKARAAVVSHPASLIIGSDQVAELDGLRLDKPGSRDRAQEQLQRASGREVVFHTAVTLLEAHSGRTLDKLVPTRVRFRALTSVSDFRLPRRRAAVRLRWKRQVRGFGYRVAGADPGGGPNGADRLAFDRGRLLAAGRRVERAVAVAPADSKPQSRGVLFLIPSTLGDGQPESVLPGPVILTIRELDGFIAEEPKTARAFLRGVGMQRPLTEIRIQVLNEHTDATDLPKLLDPVIEGERIGLLSEAGYPAVADPGSRADRARTRAQREGRSTGGTIVSAAGTGGVRIERPGLLLPRLSTCTGRSPYCAAARDRSPVGRRWRHAHLHRSALSQQSDAGRAAGGLRSANPAVPGNRPDFAQ